MKKNYFLLMALGIMSFSNASTPNTYTSHQPIPPSKTITKNPNFANNDVQLVSAKMDKFLVVGTQTFVKATLKNVGSNSVSSVEISWNDGTGARKERITAYLSANQQKEFTHPIAISFSDPTVETKNIEVSITKVNDNEDSNPADNTVTIQTSMVSQQVSKKVVFEEGTGTWCGWCPRGMVALNKVNADYPDDQITIAIHNGDPMVSAEYNSQAGFKGFPGMHVDRELKSVDINPSSIINHVVSRKNLPAPATLMGDYSISGSQLSANVNAQFFINKTNANYRLSVIILEDGVKGTANGYRQANYYAGGEEMGGYENLPNPVPAALMVYDHVGRAILGGHAGQTNSVSSTITDGSTANYNFNYTIPAEYDINKIKAVLLLIDANDGVILNAAKLTKSLAVSDFTKIGAKTSLYPNPAKSNFSLKFPEEGQYQISIHDMMGREVKNYGKVKIASKDLKFDINTLAPGQYLVNIAKEGVSFTKNLLVK